MPAATSSAQPARRAPSCLRLEGTYRWAGASCSRQTDRRAHKPCQRLSSHSSDRRYHSGWTPAARAAKAARGGSPSPLPSRSCLFPPSAEARGPAEPRVALAAPQPFSARGGGAGASSGGGGCRKFLSPPPLTGLPG